ncbi:MAG: polysaccharide lyase [Cytophagaceae bacterium]|nr:polysaccharide lyase [Cytophagaceae bacterium]
MMQFRYQCLLLLIAMMPLRAQLMVADFEGYTDETTFTQSSWTSEGFTAPWVNGFNQNRAYVDHAYARNGTGSLRVSYPSGQFGPSNTGAQAPLQLTPANQYYISYWFRFSDNFSFGTTNEGGKLPGLAGGGNCSGCNNCTGSNGFTARLMWRANGRLVLYLYHLDKINPPCGDDYTLKPGGIDFYASKGQWVHIIERVKVNTGTNHDGEVEIWVNQQPALLKTGIQFVSNGDKVDNFYFSTFHGGNSAGWAPTVNSFIWFDDVKVSPNASDMFTTLEVQKDMEHLDEVEIPFPTILQSGNRYTSFNHPEPSLLEWYTPEGTLRASQRLDGKDWECPQLPQGFYLLKYSRRSQFKVKKVWVMP